VENMKNKPCNNTHIPQALITLFRYITIFYGIDNILQNIPTFRLDAGNILKNIVSPTYNPPSINVTPISVNPL
jgi:hypothetical protein